MKRYQLSFLVVIVFILNSCKSGFKNDFSEVKSISIDTVLNQKISIRAILVDSDKIWFAGNGNKYGFYDIKTNKLQMETISDTSKLEFRSIAQNDDAIFVTNIGNPATIFRINKSNLKVEKVYTETHEKVFYDSMNFWNNDEGILIGDPISNCLSIVITRNGGKTWQKVPCENLPKTFEGEAAFAASNTNVVIKGNHCWIVSGGLKSRVFYSSDKGKNWEVFETPIVQGQAMTGIFTADFYDEKIGFVAGGNYEILTQNFQNKAITFDGGKKWGLIAENQGFGYASCVQFMPNSGGREIVSVGATGLNYSPDFGKTWKQFSKDNSLYTIRFVSPNLAFAAGKDKIVRIILDRKI
ncbi:MAG: oxidoreductase [Flavobacterium sp.]|uniref:WD40/YVTN/BNR-like repeat-containing protein n=1 Tax=Flavobacterium sp. TaxID=239 RepID=UPI0022C3EC8C|nr:oxidoreductase [Flavobacterium sp.]MCZ8331965.1 oxidoreductase [Flavobacterium sp.]